MTTSPFLTRHACPDARLVTAACGRVHVVPSGFLYAGRFDDVTNQRHSAVVYVALTADAFEVQTATARVVTGAVFIGPGVRKRIRAKGPVASLDITPTHRAFPRFARAGATPQAWPRVHFAAVQPALADFRSGDLDMAAADRLYEQVLGLAADRLPPIGPLDPRIRDVLRLLHTQRGRPTQDLAAAVNLSKDWLAHLFQREMGLPLRRYEQALKIQAAAAYLKRGVSLTEVAAIAGFSDSAHFSKLWKQHYGFAPHRSFSGDELFIDPMPWPPCTGMSPGLSPHGPARAPARGVRRGDSPR